MGYPHAALPNDLGMGWPVYVIDSKTGGNEQRHRWNGWGNSVMAMAYMNGAVEYDIIGSTKQCYGTKLLSLLLYAICFAKAVQDMSMKMGCFPLVNGIATQMKCFICCRSVRCA